MPRGFIIGEVQTIIRRKLQISKEECLFLLVNEGKDLTKSNHTLEDVFEKYKDEDGFLYVLYTNEYTLG